MWLWTQFFLFDSWLWQHSFLFPKRPHWLYFPISPPYSIGTFDHIPGSESTRDVKLTTQLHLVPRLVMNGAVPSTPQFAIMTYTGTAYLWLCSGIFSSSWCNTGARGGAVVEALRYNPEGRGFDSRWCHWNFSWDNTSGRTMGLRSTQPLTEMNTRNISWGPRRPVRRTDNLATFMCRLS
jgi:hypothetical protein